MRITVSGPPGSGTTTLARYLARTHGFELISAGELFRELARERGMTLAEFGALAEKDVSIDAMIDARQKEVAAGRDRIVAEGRLSGWMVEDADLKIWLHAPIACRARRIAERDGTDEYTARDLAIQREDCEYTRYLHYYGIDIRDLSRYDIVLNSEHWNPEALGAIVDVAIGALKKPRAGS
ncbi:MAG: AAA family ATPase [Methanomicrobiales archaeon]|nr:AAA family ATPase [Methanomicrobiales archaeon]MDD1648200.1 AAA family ATPase [Methanomicrobiales archaeon]